VTAARRAVALAPDDPQAALLVARGLRANGDPAGAAGYLKPMLEKQRDNAALHAELGWAYLQQRRFTDAAAAFREALRLQPRAADAQDGLIATEVAAGHAEAARTTVARWRQADPANVHLQVLMAKLELAAGRVESATEMLTGAVATAPDEPDAYALLAQIYTSRGRLDAAIAQYQQLTRTLNVGAGAQTMIGLLEEQRGQTASARAAYEKALEIDPESGTAANNLAWLYAESGRLDEALRLATDAEKRLRNRPEPADTAGWVHYRKNEFEQAATKFSEAVKRAPDRAIYHYHLALARAKEGRREEARASLQRATALGLSKDDAAAVDAALGQ